MNIEEAIKQRTFSSETQRTAVNLLYTASWFSGVLSRTLKPLEISWQQFNIMRILKGQDDCAVTLKTVSERMVDPMSNTSRLVEKLVAKGFVERKANSCDRRQVMISLTQEGLDHLTLASQKVSDLNDQLFGHVSKKELTALSEGLDKLRQK